MTQEKYWFQDLNVILDMEKINEIYPKKDMSYQQKTNSLVRLTLIVGVVLSLLNGNSNWLTIPVTYMTITYVLYLFRIEKVNKEVKKIGPNATQKDLPKDIKEKFTNVIQKDNCAKISTKNPFMNAMPFDNRNRNPACNVLNEDKQMNIEENFNKNLFRDAGDIFDKNNGQRQFYTMPSTTYPNNRTSFANWLYKTPPTCKEGNGAQCVANIYHPIQRRLFAPGHGSSTN